MIANSTGGLDDVVELVAAILAGKAVEVFGTDPNTGAKPKNGVTVSDSGV